MRQRYLMLFILMLVGVCSVTDRSIVAIVLEPIKKEFTLSDAQLGLLTGLAFAAAHAVVALPAGSLADRVSRRKLIAASLVIWSGLTLLCGAAQNFIQLLLCRMGVGAGEAGGQSAVMSSVSDLFPPERRGTAISIYYLCAPLAALLGGGVGGLVAGLYGWRAAMAAAAVPGVVLALVMLFCRDVPREGEIEAPDNPGEAPRLGEVLRFIASQRALVHLIAAAAVITVVISGTSAFGYSFFIRYHHMQLRTLGPLLGGLSGLIGFIVIPGSGVLTDWLGKRDPRIRLLAVAGVLLVATPLLMLSYLAPQPYALGLYMANLIIQGFWLGPLYGTVQNLAQPRMRSTVAAVLFVVNGVIGVGFGPVIVGLLSDVLSKSVGAQGLRGALLITTAIGFWAALHFVLATRTLQGDLARARRVLPEAKEV